MSTVFMNEERIIILKADIIFRRVIGSAELAPEFLEQKYSRLDLNLVIDRRNVNIEMHLT